MSKRKTKLVLMAMLIIAISISIALSIGISETTKDYNYLLFTLLLSPIMLISAYWLIFKTSFTEEVGMLKQRYRKLKHK